MLPIVAFHNLTRPSFPEEHKTVLQSRSDTCAENQRQRTYPVTFHSTLPTDDLERGRQFAFAADRHDSLVVIEVSSDPSSPFSFVRFFAGSVRTLHPPYPNVTVSAASGDEVGRPSAGGSPRDGSDGVTSLRRTGPRFIKRGGGRWRIWV